MLMFCGQITWTGWLIQQIIGCMMHNQALIPSKGSAIYFCHDQIGSGTHHLSYPVGMGGGEHFWS